MKITIPVVLFLSSLLIVSSCRRPVAKHVILLGIDGLSTDGIQVAKTPDLDQLIREGAFSIRQGKWKLEICPGSGGWTLPPNSAVVKNKPMIQLYDLNIDINEQYNLHAMYPDVVYRLTNLLEEYVATGRSTPGLVQKNDGDPNIWRPIAIRDERYKTLNVTHLAVGKQVQVLNGVSLKYTESGEQTLTDGIRASSWHSDGNWVGVEGDDLVTVIDLNKIYKISKITAGFLEDQNYWIFHPLQVEFSLSEDGKKFRSLKTIPGEEPKESYKRNIKNFKLHYGEENARYIKMKAKNLKTCPKWHKGAGGKARLFVDEIIV